jgi:hypothetical protein
MGEMIFAVFFGAWMVFLGVFLHVSLAREEQSYRAEINHKNACSEKGDY